MAVAAKAVPAGAAATIKGFQMTLQEILAALLNPGGSQQNQLSMAGAPGGVGDHNNPALLRQAQQGLAQPPQMPQGGLSAAIAPQMAPQGQPMPQNASQAAPAPAGPSGGGLGGLLGNLFGGGAGAGENQTVQWLTGQGIDPGTATMMAKHKPALQQYLLQRSQGADPSDLLAREKFEWEKSQAGTTTTDALREYQFAKGEGYEGSFSDWRKKDSAMPAGVQEYEYAKAQGFPGTFQDWEASKKGGMSLQVDPETGAVTFQQGGNIKPLTESQSKDTVYSTRAAGALPLIDKFGEELTSLPQSVGGQVPGVGNYLKSKEYQQAEQAGKEFLQAILRKDTGAAIHQHEMESYGVVYLPRPGDSPEVLAQKKASRSRALEAIKAGMPAQAILAQERALAAGGTDTGSGVAQQPKSPPQVGEARYGYKFKGGDPSEPSNWEKAK